MSHKSEPIRFICDPAKFQDLPFPSPSKDFIPDWYRKTPRTVSNRPAMTTVKACIPFYEALATGWAIPMWVNLTIRRIKDQTGVWSYRFETESSTSTVDIHPPEQLGEHHPMYPNGPLKLISPWTIKTPFDYSIIITAPWNRPDIPIEVLTGIVQSDKYSQPVNFPFYLRGNAESYFVPKGMPIAQIVPLHRSSMIETHETVEATPEDQIARRESEQVMSKVPSVYRAQIWDRNAIRKIPDKENHSEQRIRGKRP